MNLYQLLMATPDAGILAELKARYGDDFDDVIGAYTPVLATLRSLAPDAASPGALQIDVDETGWHDAGLITPDGVPVSPSLMAWASWLAVDIPMTLRTTFTDAVILAVVLWDMTFYGFTDAEVTAKGEEIMAAADRAVAECKAASPADRITVDNIPRWLAAIRAEGGADTDDAAEPPV